jgi:hypothetical protein
MAKNRSDDVDTHDITRTVIEDNGRVIAELGAEEVTHSDPDGTITTIRTSRNLVTSDRMVFNAGMLVANPPIYIGVCDLCRTYQVSLFRRQRPTHGITTLARLKECECGAACCPRHRVLSPWDQKYRCPSCARKHAFGRLLRFIFTSE